jgi:tetratricopeptide (TPR) repeat protein/predicted Ser/Thr protein kinase
MVMDQDATVTSMDLPSDRPVIDQDATVTSLDVPTKWAHATRVQETGHSQQSSLAIGGLLAGRYEIVKMLGEGGMGAVYKARDVELDRLVAIKVIRPELAGHPSVMQRFKQELILARKITHRNVIRIFDLGVADGFRFITMEFVEGKDLSTLLEEREHYELEEAVKILRQICAGLESAHAEGVVHRDLKPQNILIEPGGRVCVMDFGLARSLEATGMTQMGAVMGTPAYMSPEQAKGMTADERSDIFSLGIIAYQMFTGKVPFKADTALASMLLRTQGPPTPPIELNPALPKILNDIVMKALATQVHGRYLSASLMDADLQDWQNGVLHKKIVTPRVQMMEDSQVKKWIAVAAAAAAVLGAAGYFAYGYFNQPAATVSPRTVVIADFNNHTGDPVFNGTLESTLKLALEGASFISAYDRTRMRDLGLPTPADVLDEKKAQAIAVSQGLNVVVAGALDKSGASYQLSLRAIQAATGEVITSAEETAANKDQVLFAVTKLAAAVRKGMGDSTSESAQRLAMESLSAGSLEAVHEYSAALDALSRGKNEEAFGRFSRAVDLDSSFGLAYAGMGSTSHNLGREQDAEKYNKEAITHIDHMTERERYRARASLYLRIGDYQKCVEEYGDLLAKYSADTGAYNNMAICSTKLRKLPKALEQVQRAVAILPQRAMYHVNLSFYSSYASDFQLGNREASKTLELNPKYASGFLAQAFASLGRGETPAAADAYRKLEAISASDAATGLADLAVYEGRYKDAIGILEKGTAADQAARKPDAAADKLAMLAYVQLLRQQKPLAVEAADRALALSKAVKIRFLTGRVFVELGEAAKAKELADGLSSEILLEPQVYARLLEGEAALKAGQPKEAVRLLTEANTQLDTWMGRFDLGRAYLELGSFAEADSEFDKCLQRRGEVLALFLDEVPTFGYFPAVYYYQGRVREGMKSAGFAEAYRKYEGIRGQAGEDPLLADIQRRTRK